MKRGREGCGNVREIEMLRTQYHDFVLHCVREVGRLHP
jgi:hypothetical protein